MAPDDARGRLTTDPSTIGRRRTVACSSAAADDVWRRWCELTYLLVKLGKEYAEQVPGEPWEDVHARGIVEHFATNS